MEFNLTTLTLLDQLDQLAKKYNCTWLVGTTESKTYKCGIMDYKAIYIFRFNEHLNTVIQEVIDKVRTI